MDEPHTMEDLARHVSLNFLVVILIFACATGLNIAEHLLEDTVDKWLLIGFKILSIFAFLADAVYFMGLCVIVIIRTYKGVKEEFS